jgi:hypothetical protein
MSSESFSESTDGSQVRDLDDIESVAAAREFIVRLEEGPEFCSWCLTRKRDGYPEYDEAVAKQLSAGATKQTFEALGNRIAPDGSVEAAQWTFTPVSNAEVEYSADGGKVVYCPGCDRANGRDGGTTRGPGPRHPHFDNLLDGFDRHFDREAGHAAIREANKNCDPDDQDIFARALFAAIGGETGSE